MSGKNVAQIAQVIQSGQAVIGIEMGSTRIKAVLIDTDNNPVASGGFRWENSLKDGVWTYPLEEVWAGIQAGFADLQKNVQDRYGVKIKKVKAFGFSGMMHGYLVFDADGNQLVPFRTWRNNITGQASEELTKLFDYPIPQRWSIAHLYQSILNGEKHTGRIAHMTTLAGYVHWRLTGKQVMGIGEASGMFPIDIRTKDFNLTLADRFDAHVADKKFRWKLKEILPQVLSAGDPAGVLTAEGARLLDPAGNLEAGIPFCPPEGDAGTGMVATNSVETAYASAEAVESMWGADPVFTSRQNFDGSRTVEWLGADDGLSRTYTVWYTTDLTSAWEMLYRADNVYSFTDSVHAGVPVIYYKVSVE